MKLYGVTGNDKNGVFNVPSPVDKKTLNVIASSDLNWDHVSVSRKTRPPNWREMEFIKRMFFENNETAMQLHVPPSDHINHHPHCLHMWRPLDREIPLPPDIFV